MNEITVLLMDTMHNGIQIEVFQKRERVKDFLLGWLDGDEELHKRVIKGLDRFDMYEEESEGWSISVRNCPLFI
jgi:hypothetical protein